MSLLLALWEFGGAESDLASRAGRVSRLERLGVVGERKPSRLLHKRKKKLWLFLWLSWVLSAECCLSAFPCLFFVTGFKMNYTADFFLPCEGIETIREGHVGICPLELSLLETAMLWLCLPLFGLVIHVLVWHPCSAKGSTVRAVQGSG